MQNDILIKGCIICTIIGIILLIIVSDKIDIKTSEIGSIDHKLINKNVKIRGIVKKADNRETIAFLNIEDKTGEIKTIAFKPENLNINKGSMIEIEGKVALYDEKLEVYAERIKIIN